EEAGSYRNFVFYRQLLCVDLRTESSHRFGGGAHKDDSCLVACFRERSALAEKSVAGMDGVRAAILGGLNDLCGVKIAFRWLCFADAVRLVRKGYMHGVFVGFAVDGDGADTHFAGTANDANCDLS